MASYEKQQNGTWSVRFRFMEFGKTKNKRLSGFKLRREAEAAYRDFVRNFTPTEAPNRITVTELSKLYLDYFKDKNKISTFVTVEPYFRLHILPYLGDLIFTEVTDADLKLWKTKIDKFSYNYKDHLWSALKAFFHYAEFHHNLINNSYRKVPPFKREIRQTWEYWTEEEFKQFIKSVDDPALHAAFNTLYLTGLRKGELLALRWSDVDLTRGTINVNKTLTYKTGGQGYAFTTPKTKNSQRVVAMPKNLNEELRALPKNVFVFGKNESPLAPETFRRWLGVYAKKANVKSIKIHEIRHSHVSLLINKGDNDLSMAYAIAERIGDSVEQILKTYGHLFRGSSEKLLAKLEDI